ncbi:MAG: hypothetical protein ACTMH7_05430, partial [Leuconostoc fallax]
ISSIDRLLIGGRLWLQSHTVSPSNFYGLEFSDVIEETVPLFIEQPDKKKLVQRSIKNTIKKIQS